MVKRARIVAFFILLLALLATIGTTSNGILKKINLGLDLQGGFEVLYQVKPEKGKKVTEATLKSTASALEKRVNVLGVSEPNIQIEGKDRIRVQLAGVKDQDKAREILSTQAKLTFRDFNDKVMLSGADLKANGAKQSFYENTPAVEVTLKDANKFGEITKTISGMPAPTNVLAIWLDFEEGKDSFQKTDTHDNMISAPSVTKVIDQNTVFITGNFKMEEATELANLLNAGALPVELDEKYSTSVGAKFGEEALHKTIEAGIIGIAAIFLFMMAYYRFPGVLAVITLAAYIYLTLLVFQLMNGVLTLPGLAALVLGVGIAVDTNIITYERIKDEIKIGRTIKSAFAAGNKHSFITILDANLTTLLAAGVLFVFGTSSVRGFATMLIIAILISFITNVFFSRILLGLWVQSGFLNKKAGWFGVRKKDIHDLKDSGDPFSMPTRFDRIDFVKHRKKFYIFSAAITVIGIVFLLVFKLNLAIDFTNGTRIEIPADKSLTATEIEEEFKSLDFETDDVILSGNNNTTAVARLQDVLTKEEISKVKDHFEDKYGSEPAISTVSPTIGRELAKNAIYALLIASAGIIIYVTLRYEWKMAFPAVLALLHDAFFIITVFSLLRMEVDITFIAAVLTIVGYSINDTIVTFDRIRENMKKKRKIKDIKELEDIVNLSLRQTFGRSVNTVLMVIIPVIALLFFGSGTLFNFSFALLLGLLCGVYSSLFIASQIWLDLKEKEIKEKGSLITYVEKKKSSSEPQV
ncbi:protein translocase subunit SecDF [Peribacillus deserti]|uniref:Multifunctional fusion protein n=1 Tax=Peribacillus deserti TaxID=673318 RepID=A0A2N5M946_9BACI|nr:protein translocase subunit SecDF [Peribacillus deserti]PLT30881.1 protein translocase subunit SecDF [Peribacillus deserti]